MVYNIINENTPNSSSNLVEKKPITISNHGLFSRFSAVIGILMISGIIIYFFLLKYWYYDKFSSKLTFAQFSQIPLILGFLFYFVNVIILRIPKTWRYLNLVPEGGIFLNITFSNIISLIYFAISIEGSIYPEKPNFQMFITGAGLCIYEIITFLSILITLIFRSSNIIFYQNKGEVYADKIANCIYFPFKVKQKLVFRPYDDNSLKFFFVDKPIRIGPQKYQIHYISPDDFKLLNDFQKLGLYVFDSINNPKLRGTPVFQRTTKKQIESFLAEIEKMGKISVITLEDRIGSFNIISGQVSFSDDPK